MIENILRNACSFITPNDEAVTLQELTDSILHYTLPVLNNDKAYPIIISELGKPTERTCNGNLGYRLRFDGHRFLTQKYK